MLNFDIKRLGLIVCPDAEELLARAIAGDDEDCEDCADEDGFSEFYW